MENRAIFLPQAWLENASLILARLNDGQSCHLLLPLQSFLEIGETNPLKFDQDLNIQSALVVFPKSYQNSEFRCHWPSWIQSIQDTNFVCGFMFLDRMEEFLECMRHTPVCKFPDSFIGTCQYQPPYTLQLDDWEQRGIQSLHPGDYFKNELLAQLTLQGAVWMYWGHGDWYRLRGYGHIDRDDLSELRREKSFAATLWFACSTFDFSLGTPLAWEWYQQGKTKCLLCSPEKVSTQANQLFASQLLQEIIESTQEQSIAELLRRTFESKKEGLNSVQDAYYLLGNPWVRVGKDLIG
jgi:hypothetical protein